MSIVAVGVISIASQPPAPGPIERSYGEEHPGRTESNHGPHIESAAREEQARDREEAAALNRRITRATVASAVAAVAMVFIGILQLFSMRRQAAAMDEQVSRMERALESSNRGVVAAEDNAKAAIAAARAAQANTDALISAERSWLTVEASEDPAFEDIGPERVGVDIVIQYRNWGKQLPAWVNRRRTVVDLIDFPGGIPVSSNDTRLAPKKLDGGFPEQEVPPGPGQPAFRYRRKVTVAEYRSLLAGKSALMLHGALGYRDIFGQQRPTPFCWIYFVKEATRVPEGTEPPPRKLEWGRFAGPTPDWGKA